MTFLLQQGTFVVHMYISSFAKYCVGYLNSKIASSMDS